ncbi:class F sortase [Candidatus Beckwithbacteria bacterium]|nr:class F sortase [Candidatus Beckwithbacteria bacterium]
MFAGFVKFTNSFSYGQLLFLNLFVLIFSIPFYFFVISASGKQNLQQVKTTLAQTVQKKEASSSATSLPTPTPTPRAIPNKLQIPDLKVNTLILPVGYDKQTGAMEVPEDAMHVGWYEYGFTPGEKGSAVMTAHYDTPTGALGIFATLAKLKENEYFYVDNDQGQQLQYQVTEVIQFPLDNYPEDKIWGEQDFSQVVLVTCSGVWNASSKLYSHRLAIFGKLVKTTQMDVDYIAAKDKETPDQFVVEPFDTQIFARDETKLDSYLKLKQEDDHYSLYLASNNQDILAINAIINVVSGQIKKENIIFGNSFASYNFIEKNENTIELSMFTDPAWKIKELVNTKDKELKIAEIYYKGELSLDTEKSAIVNK